MRKRPLPYDIQIPQPCTAEWNGMEASTSASRHCELCDHAVHDLAAMTPRQVQRLVSDTSGHFCARVTHRADGSLVLQEPPPSAFAAAGLLLAAALATGSATTVQAQGGQCGDAPHAASVPVLAPKMLAAPAPTPPPQQQAYATMGRIAMPERLSFVSGHVSLPQRVGVFYGTVTAVQRGGRQWTADVGKDGTYSIGVPAGSYTLSAAAQGVDGQHWMQNGLALRVTKDSRMTQDFSPKESIFVTAGAPMVVPNPKR